jgi:hypothetical protein
MFPLYNSICSNLPEELEKISLVDVGRILEDVKSFDDNGHELIYTLIKVYHINNTEGSNLEYPYGSKLFKTGIRFDFNQLPLKLQHVIFNFVEMHKNI